MTAAAPAAEIHADAAYGLEEFSRRTGLGPEALRTARRKNPGLVKRCGNRAYIVGRDWLDHLARFGSGEPRTA